MRLLTTEVLTEALALYESAGYAVVGSHELAGRRDMWLERRLGGYGPPRVRLSPPRKACLPP